MPKRTTITVSYAKAEGWKIQAQGGASSTAATKADAVRAGVQMARAHEPSSLRIKGQDGRVQEERTYPRSSDPRRTPG